MGTAFRDSNPINVSKQMSHAMTTVEVIHDPVAFKELRQQWTELLQDCPCNNLFLTWEWMYTWWMRLSEQRTLNLVIVRRDDQLIAIAPLALRPSRFLRLRPFTSLEFIASGSVGSDYLSILIRSGHEEDALRELANYLTRSKLMLEFVRVEKSSFLMINMALQLRQSGWECISLTTNYCPYIKLAERTWESYVEGLHRGHRADIRKKQRRMHKDYAVRFEQARTELERKTAMETLIKMHLQRWSKQGGSTAFNERELVCFHQDLSAMTLASDWLRLYTLTLGGVPAASLYMFCYNKVFYYYQAAYNPDFGKYSVGMVALSMGIKAAIEESACEFDFLHDDEEYKYLWAKEERELIRLDLYPPKKLGRIYKQVVLTKCALKRALWHLSARQQREY
jgi:CelD/BcsL family acetyltransferase involved in cellulose biosynthesis